MIGKVLTTHIVVCPTDSSELAERICEQIAEDLELQVKMELWGVTSTQDIG